MAVQVVRAAALGIVVLAALWSWWAIEHGAYFPTVMLPGAILLAAAFALLVGADASDSPRPGTAALVAGFALAALGLWSGLSGLWSPAPDVALADALRTLTYAIAFGFGVLMRTFLPPHRELALVPLVAAAAIAGAYAVIGLLSGDDARQYLERDGTLDHPLGYRNANAAFFAIAVWPALALTANRALGIRWRALAFATAVLSLELVLASQSRASIFAGVLAVAVFVVLAPDRARWIVWMLLAAAAALVSLPAIVELFRAVNDSGAESAVDELNALGGWALVGALAGILLGAAGAWLDDRFSVSSERLRVANRVASIGIIAIAVLGVAGFVVATGDPIDYIGQRAEEFRTEPTPRAAGKSTRLAIDLGSNRADLWRVALDRAGAEPLLGDGAGAYQYAYTRARDTATVSVRDAHSVELEVLSELGIPGVTMLVVALVAAGVGVFRSRRLGRSEAALAAAALTAATYWLAHASVDWFWAYPALCAPVLALLGSACEPGRERAGGGRGARVALVAALAAVSLLAIPPFLSDRYVDEAFSMWREDPARAYEDLASAAELNPLAEEPLLAEGAIARASGEPKRAIAAFREAAEKRPDEWAAHYLLGLLLRERNPEAATLALEAAQELNPRSGRIRQTLEELQAKREKSAGA